MSDEKNKIEIRFNPSVSIILFLIFMFLKIGNVIDWSWMWITSPLWLPFVLIIGFTAIIVLVMIIVAIADFFVFKK